MLKAGAKKARNRQTQHSPRGLLSLMEPCEDNKCRAWGNVTKKKFSLQPPSSHVAHEDLGGKWSWRNENADLHSPQGGAGTTHGPPLGPQHLNPCAAHPRPAAAGPPWPPTEPQIKKNETGQCGSPHNQGTGAGSSGPGRAFLECNSGATGALGGGGGCGGGGPAPSTPSSDLAWNVEDAARRALSN